MFRTRRLSVAKAVLVGGLLAASLDILDPIIFFGMRGVRPLRILQSIASGLLGRSAYSGGIRTAVLGLGLHLCIALAWAAAFVAIARIAPILFQRALMAGLLYGVFVYVVMNYLVLPHSHAAVASHPSTAVLVNGIAAVVFLVGLPISLANSYFAPRPRVSSY